MKWTSAPSLRRPAIQFRGLRPDAMALGRLALLALGFGLLTAIALPIAPVRSAFATISIRNTGRANPASKGQEVWITGFRHGPGASELISNGKLDPGWEVRGRELVSSGRQPAVARWEGPVDDQFSITLVRHPWSGVAEVTINQYTFVYDLFTEEGPALVMSPRAYVDKARWKIYWPQVSRNAIWMVGLTVIWGILGWMIWLVKSRGVDAQPESSTEAKRFATVLFALPSLLLYGLVHLSAWPAAMSPDSVSEWQGALNGVIEEALIPLHMFVVWLLAKIWQSPAIVILAQIIGLSTATALVLAELSRWGSPKWLLWLLAILFPLLPANFLMAVTLWKDVAYAVGMLLVLRYLLELIRTDAQALRRWQFRLGFAVSLLFVDLFRHNGLMVAGPAVLLTGLAFRRSGQFKFFAILGVALLALPLLLHSLAYPALRVRPIAKIFQAGAAMHLIGAMVADGVEFPPEQRSVLDSVMPREVWAKDYNCQTSVPLFWNKRVDYGAFRSNTETINQIAIQAVRKRPDIFAKHELCLTSMIWQILPDGAGLLTVPVISVFKDNSWPSGPALAPKLPALTRLIKYIEALSQQPEYTWIVWRPAIYLYLLIFIVSALAIIHREAAYLCLALPGFLNTLSLLPAIGSPDYRYQYGVVVTVLMLVPLLFTAGRPMGKPTVAEQTLATQGAQLPIARHLG